MRTLPTLLPAMLSLALFLGACSGDRDASPKTEAGTPQANPDQRFAALSQRWLDESMRLSPVNATQSGDHRYDSLLDDLSAEGRNAQLALSDTLLIELQALDRSQLSRANQVDAAMLANSLRYTRWQIAELQGWAWDPLLYTGLAGSAVYTLMARDFAPLPQRLDAAAARLERLPELLVQMRVNLDPARVPSVHAETAASQMAGVNSLIDEFLVPGLQQLEGEPRARLDAAITAARSALSSQTEWIAKELVPAAKGDFRLGAKLYDAKLAFALESPLSREEIRQRASAELERSRAQMYQLARNVLPGGSALPDEPSHEQQQKTIAAALEMAYQDRPGRDAVVDLARASLQQSTDFVRERDLIRLPESPLQIILMPEFQRGVSVAYCDSPGPLDQHLDTFYAVSPIPEDWTDTQVGSFLREYNTRSIHELTIHEAMPGHYVQIAHANAYPSTLRAVLYSGPFVEGWAVYAERMMADAGYMGGDPLYQLIQRKWYLRTVANAILDQAIHVDGMSRDDAMKLMVETTFQEEREAAGKWVRAQLTSAQLPTYFVGAQEHFALRAEAQQRWGEAFKLRDYHDRVLSYGSPPVRYVRALLLDEPIP